MDHSPPGSSFLSKNTGVISSSRESSQSWIEAASPASLALAGRFFTIEPSGKPLLGKPEIVFPGGSDGKVSACNAGDPGSIRGLGRSPGEGNGDPLQYSCLENSMDGEATVHGVAKSQT